MLKIIVYINILVLGMFSSAIGQTSKSNPNDVEGWASIDFNFNLPKKFEFEFSYQARTENNISRYKGSYFTTEIGYKVSKKIKTFSSFRYAAINNGNSSRIGAGLEYSDQIQKWEVIFKPQMQYTIKYAEDGDIDNSNKWILRTKLGIKYPLSKKIDAYSSIEPFCIFDQAEYFINNIRNTIGLKYEYSKNRKLDLFYIYRPDFSRSYNRIFHIIGVNIDLAWKI